MHAVFKHYREKHDHWRRYRYPEDKPVWRLVQARLREGFTVEELCKAIDGYEPETMTVLGEPLTVVNSTWDAERGAMVVLDGPNTCDLGRLEADGWRML